LIAVDTNILVYATREDSPHHRAAAALLRDLAEGAEPWGLPWPCVYEFVKVVTHPRVFVRPTSLEDAVEAAEAMMDSPSVVLLGQGSAHRGHFRRMVLDGQSTGNRAHDAHVAALATEHGVKELLTADRDLARFPGIRVRNPFA
jgi:toxin-antitoxin system PIN domain toxin